MPNYSFKCQDCGHEFDVLAKFSELDKLKCEVCSSSNLERVYKRVGLNVNSNTNSSSSSGG